MFMTAFYDDLYQVEIDFSLQVILPKATKIDFKFNDQKLQIQYSSRC